MTIFRFIGGGGGEAQDFHVWSADSIFADGTTYMSGGGGAITSFNGPAEPPNIPLRLPVPAGIIFTRISIWWRVSIVGPIVLSFTVRNATAGVDIHVANVATSAGPGLVLSEVIPPVAATALDDEIEVVVGNPNPQGENPSDIFVRLDYRRI